MKLPHPHDRRFAPILALALAAAFAAPPAMAQCGVVADLTPGNANDNNIAHMVAAFGEELYLSYFSSTTGSELWKWDAQNGAQIVVDLAPGSGNSGPAHITPCCTALGPRVFYSGFEIGHGHELYASDGTAAGTGRVKEIRAGSGSSLPFDFAASGGKVFFNARDAANGEELWVSDGTTPGTVRLSDFAPGSGNGRPNDMIDLNGRVVFSAFDPAVGRELFISDGTPVGTHVLLDIEGGPAASNPGDFTRVGDVVYFLATTVTHGREVWKTDGSATGTVMIADTFTGNSFGPTGLCACGDRLFFHESRGSGTGDVYVTDGTAAGTVNVGVTGTDITCSGDRVFFTGHDFLTGAEPWTSDGTIAGTRLVADLAPGSSSSSPNKYVDCGPGVCFTARTAVGSELWYSDGTTGGTTLLCTLDPGGNANPDQLTMCRGRLFMNAYDPNFGRELIGIQTPGASKALLGAGGGPDYPTIDTARGAVPILGTTIDIEGEGPSGHTAFLLISGPGLPSPLPVIPGLIDGGCDWVGLQAGAAVTIVNSPTSSFSVSITLPDHPAFEGLAVNFQALWARLTASPALQASNGLQLVLGTAAPH